MRIYVNDKEYNLDYSKLQKDFISSGYEADVYKFDNKVLKIYKEICLKYRLDESGVDYLSKIHTNRVLLPQEVVYDENREFLGYTMKYIEPISKEEISNIKMDKVIKELFFIKRDLLLLKEKNVFIDDLCDSNFIFNNGIYFVDPGSFEINKKVSKEYVEIMNREIMQDFLIRFVLFRYKKLSFDEKNKLNEYFSLDEYMYDIIKKKKYNKLELIYEYSDRIINKL